MVNERVGVDEQSALGVWGDGGCPPQRWMKQARAPLYRKLAVPSAEPSQPSETPSSSWDEPQTGLVNSTDKADSGFEPVAPAVEISMPAVTAPAKQARAHELALPQAVVTQPVSFEAVLNSKGKIITRFDRAKEAYNRELSEHNSAMRAALQAFDEGDMERAGKIIITIYHSCVSLNQANINMKHALREALMAKTDMMNVHTDEKLPAAFEAFFQSVKNINTLTAEVDFYLQRIRQAAATDHDVAEKVWYQLGERLIEMSNKLG